MIPTSILYTSCTHALGTLLNFRCSSLSRVAPISILLQRWTYLLLVTAVLHLTKMKGENILVKIHMVALWNKWNWCSLNDVQTKNDVLKQFQQHECKMCPRCSKSSYYLVSLGWILIRPLQKTLTLCMALGPLVIFTRWPACYRHRAFFQPCREDTDINKTSFKNCSAS